MRIVFLHQFNLNFAGGSGVYLRALVEQFIEMGHHVDVVTAKRPDQYNCTTYQLPFDSPLTFGPQKRAGEKTLDELGDRELTGLMIRASEAIGQDLIQDARPDLIVANHINLMAGVARRLHQAFGVSYRLISYGTDTEMLMRDRRYVELFSPAARDADRVFAISEYVGRQVAAMLPVPGVDVLGGAVDKRLFYPPQWPAHSAMQVVFVGRLVTEKGILVLLDAVKDQRLPWHLEIIGEGPLFEPIASLLRDSPIRSRVRLRGYLPPRLLRSALLKAAALVMPSTWQEPLGLVVLESMACGTPVVASAVGGVPEIVQDGANGCLVEPGDASALARAIDEIVGDAELNNRLRQHCLSQTKIPSYRELAERVVR